MNNLINIWNFHKSILSQYLLKIKHSILFKYSLFLKIF
jgi:hypothetical protein